MSFSIIMQALISGCAMGLIYGLVSIEYTLIFNASGIINFAHDKCITFGGYIFAALFMMKLGCSLIVSLIGGFVFAAILAIIMSMGIFVPLRSKSRICTLLATVMVANIILEGIRLVFGAFGIPVTFYFSGTFTILGAILPTTYLYVIIIATVLSVGLQLFLKYTRVGKAMTCVNQNPVAAGLMGISVRKYITIATIMSFCVCVIIAMLLIPLNTLTMDLGSSVALKGFAAGIIGGFGFLPGGIVGGILLGIIENIACLFVSSGYKDVISFAVLIIVLMLKPAGLLRKKTSDVKMV